MSLLIQKQARTANERKTSMSELLITSSLDPIEEGDVFEEGLPRHVTIWQYFQLPDSHIDGFIHNVGHVLQSVPPLEIMGTSTDKLGSHNDVPVRLVMALGSNATIITLHSLLGEVIATYGGTIRNPEWARDNYNPHITYVNGRALENAEYAKLSTVELIQKDATTTRKVARKVWKLEDNHETAA